MSRSSALSRFSAALIVAVLAATVGGAVAQTRISNTATLAYAAPGGERQVRSNTVTLDVARGKRPTQLSLRLLRPGLQLTGMRCDPGPPAVFTPMPIDAGELAQSPKLAHLDVTTALIMVLEAEAENRDPTVREIAWIEALAGERVNRLPLMETAPDSGVFAGGFPPGGVGEARERLCDITRQRGTVLSIRFPESERSLASTHSQLIDPAGYVFDSASGALVDGARISLLDDRGRAAAVVGDDGVSAYPSVVVTGQPVNDASGRLYPGVKGRFRFPFAPAGRYTLKVEPPTAYTAPSVASRAALAELKGPNGVPFIINDASFGAAFVLVGPNPFLTDIPIDSGSRAGVLVSKTASVREAAPGDFIQYRIELTNRADTPRTALSVTDTLPPGLRYERGSTRGGAEPSVTADGRTLTFAVPVLAPSATAELRYVVTVAPGAPLGEALNRAQVTGSGIVSNEAAASVRLRALLFTDAITIIGRVTEGRCGDPSDRRKGVAGVRLLLEDGTYVVTDRDGLYHFEGVRTGRHVVQIDTASIPDTHAPLACDIDTRQAGSSISRFVEGQSGVLQRVDFQLAPTGKAAAAQDALPVEVADDATAAGARDWQPGQAPGVEWLFPSTTYNPRAPATRVVIKHAPGQRVALTVNGRQTDPLNFDATDSDAATGVAVSRWSGLPLQPGTNRLVARVHDADGRVVHQLTRDVHVAGPAVRAVFAPGQSRLVADGLTRPLIAVRITDKDGRPVRAGTLVPFRIDQPYTAHIEAELEQGRQLAGRERNTVSARVVGDDGLAFIALQPTTRTGAARVTISLAEERQVRTSEIRAWLSPSAKDWVVVGFGAGTIGYRTLDNQSRQLPRAQRNQIVTDGQLAFYAKGRVKGSWLLTIAYDSDRRYDPARGLLGQIDPDRYYTVYGDGTQQDYDAPTRRKLYLRLERREFYALFGDFETGFTDTQLTRYNRTLSGIKAGYEGRTLRGGAFVAETGSLYGRDEIQGNGLSGPYRLSGRNIVPNSDKLRLEIRDRFRSELIRSSRQLTRHIDYDIDTSAGTLRFREPILSRDSELNPTFIVADYEVEGGRTGQLVAGARAAMTLADGRLQLGAAAIRDESAGDATVVGLDGKLRIGRSTEARAEIATGGRAQLGRDVAGLAEIEHHGGALDLSAYVRQQDRFFGVGQQNLVEAGTRKFGLDGRLQLAERLSVTGQAWRQQQLDGAGERTAADLRIELRRPGGTLFAGGQFADDTGADGTGRASRLLTLGGTQALFGGKVELIGQTQVAPGGRADSVDFPVRHQLTAAYRLKPGIRLIGGYEIANGDNFVAHTAQLGFDLAPWSGGKLMTTLNQQRIGENGGRTFAQYGLSQSLQLGSRWTVDATLDANSTISGTIPEGAVINAFQPVASGGFLSRDQTNGSFVAATIGGTYRAERWSWTGRLEYRDADANDRIGATVSMLRSLGEGRTLASSFRIYRLTDRTGDAATSLASDLALALRPLDSRWSVLERFEIRHEAAGAGFDDGNVLGVPAYGVGDQATTRLINNIAVNYRAGPEGERHGVEATLYYGAKYVRGRYADDLYSGFIHVTGFELRRDLGKRLDIGVQGSVQHAWGGGAVSFSGGPSLGVSPAENLWLSAGYNISGYRDRDFERDRYTRSGPYVTVRLKFDQLSLGGVSRAMTGGR